MKKKNQKPTTNQKQSLNDVLNYVGIAIWKNTYTLFYQL